jgi:ABC-type antimicrobial peptide transport system permease subunit
MLIDARSLRTGFVTDGIAMLETDTRYAGYSGALANNVYEMIRQKVDAIPGVQSVILTRGHPMTTTGLPVVMEGAVVETGAPRIAGAIWAGPGYFEFLQIPVLYGRAIDERDRADTPSVAVISESMARQYFGEVNAVGRRFRIETDTNSWMEVVGVVRDTGTADRGGDLVDPIPQLFFRSFVQSGLSPTTILARTSLDASALIGDMQQELRALNSRLPILWAKTMEQHLEDSLTASKAMATFLGTFGALGACLAGVGLYAVLAFAVARRSREIGIRMALGAQSRQVVWTVIREVAILLGLGTGVGLALSVIGILVVQSVGFSSSALSYTIQPRQNPVALLSILAFMAIVGSAAAYIPARRAARMDPQVALRNDG